MLVVWVHVSEKFKGFAAAGTDWVYALTRPINAGRLGVVLFFAISGFVVPFSIKLAHRYPVREFLVTRFFRLYPAYWLSIPLGVVTTYWIWKIPYPTSAFLFNFTMLNTSSTCRLRSASTGRSHSSSCSMSAARCSS